MLRDPLPIIARVLHDNVVKNSMTRGVKYQRWMEIGQLGSAGWVWSRSNLHTLMQICSVILQGIDYTTSVWEYLMLLLRIHHLYHPTSIQFVPVILEQLEMERH